MAADGIVAARDRRQAGDQPPGGAADARVGRAAAVPADAAGLDARSARAGAAEAARRLSAAFGSRQASGYCGPAAVIAAHIAHTWQRPLCARSHKAVNLDLPGKLDSRSTRGGPDVCGRATPGVRRGNDRPLRAEDLQEHGPSDVSLLATCKQSAQLTSCSIPGRASAGAPTRIYCARDESEHYSQAATARPLGHQSSHQRAGQLTAAPGVEE